MKFGSREICDVTFKATADNQKVGTETFKQYQPVFHMDTATASELSQETTTVYAQGGRGNNRLIAWEGEKTMTFTVTDALLSPMGLAMLTGAGIGKASAENVIHAHITVDAVTNGSGEATIKYATLAQELGLNGGEPIFICETGDAPIYGTILDNAGAGIGYVNNVTIKTPALNDIDGGNNKNAEKITKTGELVLIAQDGEGEDAVPVKNKTVKFDMYALLNSGATEITIAPEDFGGYFYVEADTLFRREDTGMDMAATLTFPRVKIQSGFTIAMASSGDPSTFDFTMDALPGYTMFDATKKVNVAIAMIGADVDAASDAANAHPSHAGIA